jgi:general secretion pathway protein G
MQFLFSSNSLNGRGSTYTKKQTNMFGFSMIELLVVTTIIIVLTTIGLVSYRSTSVNARNAKRKADLETVRQALVLYRVEQGTYPTGNDFNAMVSQVSDYISAVEIKDPVGAPYVYSYTSNGATFSVTARLEPDQELYTLTNP